VRAQSLSAIVLTACTDGGAPMFEPGTLDENGYPAWVTALADRADGIVLSVVRGLGPAEALDRLEYPAEGTRAVRLPREEPRAPYASRVAQAVGVTDPEQVAVVSARVGDWTLVYEAGGIPRDDPAVLSVGGLRSASCSVNIESDTHLDCSADGRVLFWATEPLTGYSPGKLPGCLREAAAAAGIYDHARAGSSWDPAANFLAVCSLARLGRLTLGDLCDMPLLGWSAEDPALR
jgi:hypothetical protein